MATIDDQIIAAFTGADWPGDTRAAAVWDLDLFALDQAARQYLGGASVYLVPRPPIREDWAHPNNYSPTRPPGVLVEGIVIHTTDGGANIGALTSWFKNPDQRLADGTRVRVTATFGIGPEGEIVQYVPFTGYAFAQGNIRNPILGVVKDNGDLDPNLYLYSIEHVDGRQPGRVTPPQLASSIWLSAWLWQAMIAPNASRTGAVISRHYIGPHSEIDSVTRRHCPSWPEDRFTNYLAGMRRWLAGPEEQPPQIPIEKVQLGIIDKVIHGQYREAWTDLGKIVGG